MHMCAFLFLTFILYSLSGEEEVAHGMKVWRKALSEVRSAAQLAMCIQQLQKSIAWERSIMKVVSRGRFPYHKIQTTAAFTGRKILCLT